MHNHKTNIYKNATRKIYPNTPMSKMQVAVENPEHAQNQNFAKGDLNPNLKNFVWKTSLRPKPLGNFCA